MRVVVNVWSGLGPPAGIGHYAQQLAAALQELAAPGDFVSVFPQGLLARCYARWAQVPRKRVCAAPPNFHPVGWLVARLQETLPGSALVKTYFRQAGRCVLARFLRRQFQTVRADLYHEPNFVPLCWDVPTAITVHDLSPILFPHWHPAYRVRWLEKYLEQSLRFAQQILTVSEFTREELVRHFGISAERIQVTYPGIRRLLRPCSQKAARQLLAKAGLPTDYLLFVGTLEPRKNLQRVLRAYLHLPRSHRQAVPFILVGKYGWGAESLAELIATTGPSEGVLALGYVPENWLALLYNGARALVYPSYYEGFGLPPVEMLACGGRVVVSDLPVFRETLGPYAVRVAADDSDAWYRTLRRLVIEKEWPAQPELDGAAWVKRFSWENCARQTWEAFKTPPVAVRLAA